MNNMPNILQLQIVELSVVWAKNILKEGIESDSISLKSLGILQHYHNKRYIKNLEG